MSFSHGKRSFWSMRAKTNHPATCWVQAQVWLLFAAQKVYFEKKMLVGIYNKFRDGEMPVLHVFG
jgi:hypothetical protein